MELDHSFTVPVGVDEAWQALLDIRRIAPCMPGAAVDSVDGDEFTGTVKVKLGPIGLTYKGKASFVEKDEAAHRAVIDARGRDARGNGTAAAKVTATLTADGADTTAVAVHTELDITGKPAQFGRGVMADVGAKLIGQFADNLAVELRAPESGAGDPESGGEAESTGGTDSGGSPGERAGTKAGSVPAGRAADSEAAADSAPVSESRHAALDQETSGRSVPPSTRRPAPDVEPIDLMASAGPAVAKRLAPVAAAVVLILLATAARRRRRRNP